MTAFSPTSHPISDLTDTPHLDLPPPQQHLANGPFSHQLNPPASAFAAHNTQPPRRQSRDLRQHASNGAMAGANGNEPMPVPGGRINGQGANLREMGFAGPRSPPNNKSASRLQHKLLRVQCS